MHVNRSALRETSMTYFCTACLLTASDPFSSRPIALSFTVPSTPLDFSILPAWYHKRRQPSGPAEEMSAVNYHWQMTPPSGQGSAYNQWREQVACRQEPEKIVASIDASVDSWGDRMDGVITFTHSMRVLRFFHEGQWRTKKIETWGS